MKNSTLIFICLLMANYLAAQNVSSCPADLTDADLGGGGANPVPSGTYLAGNSIVSTGDVATGSTVVYEAGTIINLEPDFSSDVNADFSAIIGGCAPSWAPLDRTTTNITLAEEETLTFQSISVEIDFYRNTAYDCGFSGNYTFLVVEPANNPGVEAPLWVFLHGGGAGYFNEDQQYMIGVSPVTGAPRNPANHNTEKTMEDLRDGQLRYRTINNNGQNINSTLSRRIGEGYRILIVSMCDHDLHLGMGTPYLNNPNGGEVNGLQANMAAIDYTVANYPTTHVFAHGTSAGSIGAFGLAYAYNLEGIQLNGIVMDSHLASYRTETLIAALVGEPGFVFPADFNISEASEKVGWFANPDEFSGIEDAISNGFNIPSLDIYGNLDPGCGGGLDQIDEANTAGLDNCAWVHDGIRQVVEAQANSIHQVRRAEGFGHVPTHEDGAASDFVDEFISDILSTNPPHPFD